MAMETDIRTRQFNLLDIFIEGLVVFGRNWLKISVLALSIYLPVQVIGELAQLDPWIRSFSLQPLYPISVVTVAYVAIRFFVDWLFLIPTLSIAFVVEQAVKGETVSWVKAMRHGLSRWPAVMGTSIVRGLIILGLALLFIVPGIIWSVYYTFFVFVVALRNVGGKEALDYSEGLVKGQWWRVVAFSVVLSVVFLVLSMIINMPLQALAAASGIQILLTIGYILDTVVRSLFTVMMVVWFLNLDYRTAREGLRPGEFETANPVPQPASEGIQPGTIQKRRSVTLLEAAGAMAFVFSFCIWVGAVAYAYFQPAGSSTIGQSLTATSVAAGSRHTCALLSSGNVKCWGHNDVGQLGDGTSINRPAPVDVSALPGPISAIGASWDNTCALSSSGGVKCWGLNFPGTSEYGTSTVRSIPVDIAGLTAGVKAVSVGNTQFCALTSSGQVKCWEDNYYVQEPREGVTQQGLPNDATSIAAGSDYACILTSGGGIKCWGSNEVGQLGFGTRFPQYDAPVDVEGLKSGVSAIAVSFETTCALTNSGGVKCWGNNQVGQVGDGTTIDRYAPVDVQGLTSGVRAIALGGDSTCAVTSSGGVKCWGRNNMGQLGDGTTAYRSAPVDVKGLSGPVSAVAMCDSHACALMKSGGVECWGSNAVGELGDGTSRSRVVPASVLGFAP